MILKSKEIPIMNLKDPNLVDVDPKSYGYGYIAKAVELGIIHGKVNKEGEYYFDANGQLTRAQMAKVLSLAYELGGGSTYAFPDVTKNHWAYQHIQNLIGNKITTGYPNGDYGPNDPMTRAQFSVMMAHISNNAFKVEGPTIPEPKPEREPVS
jgi:amidase